MIENSEAEINWWNDALTLWDRRMVEADSVRLWLDTDRQTRPFVVIESPFAHPNADVARNYRRYLRLWTRIAFASGKVPYASHGHFPQFLADESPDERAIGMAAGLDIGQHLLNSPGAEVWFGIDFGLSPGMTAAFNHWQDVQGEASHRGFQPFRIKLLKMKDHFA